MSFLFFGNIEPNDILSKTFEDFLKLTNRRQCMMK